MLQLDRITRRFGAVTALSSFSLSVSAGEVVGFLGPNGAGKTTAMRAIMGITDLAEGTITWHDRPIDLAVRRSFGYMPEERGLYPTMRVRDQLVYLGRLHELTKTEAAVRATKWLNELGLHDAETVTLTSLSLGNQQRVQLAAALIHHPDLLILDEPFSGLDPTGIESLSALLRAQARNGAAVLFSSHQLDLVESVCDRVVIIDHGHNVCEGTVEELTQSRNVMSVRFRDASQHQPTDWITQVPSGRLLGIDHGNVRISLDGESTTVTDVLNAAAEAGEVTRIGFESKRLSEVFREAVQVSGSKND